MGRQPHTGSILFHNEPPQNSCQDFLSRSMEWAWVRIDLQVPDNWSIRTFHSPQYEEHKLLVSRQFTFSSTLLQFLEIYKTRNKPHNHYISCKKVAVWSSYFLYSILSHFSPQKAPITVLLLFVSTFKLWPYSIVSCCTVPYRPCSTLQGIFLSSEVTWATLNLHMSYITHHTCTKLCNNSFKGKNKEVASR